jgi:hypothetical protein
VRLNVNREASQNGPNYLGPIHQAPSAAAPPTLEEMKTDLESLIKSVKMLLCLVATSAAFRLILSDLLITVRETLEELAVDVERVAVQVQVGAESVVKTARLDDATLEGLKERVREAIVDVENVEQKVTDRWATVDPAERTKDTIIGRVHEVSQIVTSPFTTSHTLS